MNGYTKITRAEFYRTGGFSRPGNVRKQVGRGWTYWSAQ